MSSSIDPNLPKLVLEGDDLATLTQISYDKIRTASNNTITDFREGSPVAALVEGQVFALSELLYYTNLLPEATALELFRFYGAERSMGTYATGMLVFQLQYKSNLDFSLPAGFAVPYKDANLVLTEALFIPAGATSSAVPVRMDTPGALYNADAFGVLVTSVGLNNLQSIYNETAITGGSDMEDISETVAKLQRKINTRMSVITKTDYELAAQDLLGQGARAVCVPRLSPDKRTLAFGNVAVFLLNGDGVPASAESARQIQLELQERAIVGTAVWCFPMELYPVYIDIYVQVDTLDEAISTRIFDKVVNYIIPNKYNGGYKIRYNELAFVARSAYGCKSVESVTINGEAIDRILPNDYTLPQLSYISVSQVSPDGKSLYSLYDPLLLGDSSL